MGDFVGELDGIFEGTVEGEVRPFTTVTLFDPTVVGGDEDNPKFNPFTIDISSVSNIVGREEETTEGLLLGFIIGLSIGCEAGKFDGVIEGFFVGDLDESPGTTVGISMGAFVGESVLVVEGSSVGPSDT